MLLTPKDPAAAFLLAQVRPHAYSLPGCKLDGVETHSPQASVRKLPIALMPHMQADAWDQSGYLPEFKSSASYHCDPCGTALSTPSSLATLARNSTRHELDDSATSCVGAQSFLSE